MMIALVVASGLLLALTSWVWSWSARLRQTSNARFVESLQIMIGAHGLWGGVWLAEVSESLATTTSQLASKRAAEGIEPKGLAKLWRSADAKLVAHLQGPAMTTVAEGCGWLQHVSGDLSRSPLVGPLALKSRRLLAIVYVSRDAPRTDRRTWEDVEQLLGRRACHGSAFVLLPDARLAVPDNHKSLLFALTTGAVIGLLLGVSLAGYVVASELGIIGVSRHEKEADFPGEVSPLATSSGSPSPSLLPTYGVEHAPPGPPALPRPPTAPSSAAPGSVSAPSHALGASDRGSAKKGKDKQ